MIKGDTVLDIFLARVTTKPDNLALKFKDTELTYKQLDIISDRVANYLIAKGVTPGTLVPVSISRPIDMIVGIWSILKTGGRLCTHRP
jgi:non-ribosomal peptide synthetase component F